MRKKRILIALKMSGVAGQSKLIGIFRYLREKYGSVSPWDVTLVRSRGELTKPCLEGAIKSGTSGFIVSIPDTEESVIPLASTDIPTVVMDIHSDRLSKRKSNIVFIRNSPTVIGAEGASFLISLGTARSYAFLHSDPVTDWSRKRHDAFKRALMDAGHWCNELFEPQDALKLKRPSAILAANDDRAYELIKFLSSRRIRTPQHITVLGVDNDSLICENSHPKISSIAPDFEQEGYLAAEKLEAMMTGGEVLKRYDVGIKQIVMRESTTEQSTAGRLVQKALAFIDTRALNGITVDDVVKHINCSRRLADLRFHELQGQSILQAITIRRLDEVKRLLAVTNEKIDTIAALCGYTNPNYLKNLFKKHFGLSMRDFRQRVKGSARPCRCRKQPGRKGGSF